MNHIPLDIRFGDLPVGTIFKLGDVCYEKIQERQKPRYKFTYNARVRNGTSRRSGYKVGYFPPDLIIKLTPKSM